MRHWWRHDGSGYVAPQATTQPFNPPLANCTSPGHFSWISSPPCCLDRRNYRKRLLVGMPSLNYLDDSPCFPKDRRLAQAFLEGGLEAERAMREQVRRE